MKILVTLIVALAAVLCLLLFVEARMRPLVAESPIETHWFACDPGQYLTAAGKCEAPPATDIEITVPLPDHLPKCAPGDLYDGNYNCRTPISGRPAPVVEALMIGEPLGGMLGTGVINVMPSQKVYRNGHELMDEEQWRARLNCAASP